jgi:hypothetical protein
MKANEPSNMTDTVDKAELRPCPLCGAHLVEATDPLLAGMVMHPGGLPLCPIAALSFLPTPELVAAWNRRASHTEGAGAEPVAWRADHQIEGEYTRRYTAMKRVAEIWAEQGLTVTPLYASPTLPGDVVATHWAVTSPNGLHVGLWTERAIAQQVVDGFPAGYTILPLRTMIEAAPIPTPEGKVADADGWIEWKGGKCPVDRSELVTYRMRDGLEDDYPRPASDLTWRHARFEDDDGHFPDNDIIAYRIVPPSSERE